MSYRDRALSDLWAANEGELSKIRPVGDASRIPYRSSFGNWEQRASVRVKPRRSLEDTEEGKVYFPPELVPAAEHPLLKNSTEAGVTDRFLLQQLYSYLGFTVDLEMAAVLPVTARISSGDSGLVLPAAIQSDAFKISTDEAWHAQFSHDLIRQLEDQTGVARLRHGPPAFLQRLSEIYADLDDGVRGLGEILFAVVSETLISALLSDLPKDRRLPTAVREIVADHAEDEGRHHAYFKDLLFRFWPSLDQRQQVQAAGAVPQLIAAFLEPDYRHLLACLLDIGFDRDQAAQIVEESYPASQVQDRLREGSKATVRYFAETGVLEHSQVRDSFQKGGLL